MERKPIIGVMGGDESVGAMASEAKALGELVTRSESILLTGGCCVDNKKIKDAAMEGAKEEELRRGGTARLIGILPDGPLRWDNGHPHRLFISTNLTHKERDAINGVTPDVLIFFAGSSGTLCELTFALQAGKPVLFWKARQTLTERHRLHTKDGEIDEFLTVALNACRVKLGSVEGIGDNTTMRLLNERLAHGLKGAADFTGNVSDLVREAVRLADGSRGGPSGFPGFRDEPNSKDRFERIVERISGE
jgi:predicted Rossmann-fold nucleotide-binding protein